MRIATAGAQFAHFPGECLKPETRWRMTQSAANHPPRQISLIIRENTGNFRDFGRPAVDLKQKKPCFLCGFARIPYSTEQGILKREQGIILLEQGISFEQQGSRFQVVSTGHPGQPRQLENNARPALHWPTKSAMISPFSA